MDLDATYIRIIKTREKIELKNPWSVQIVIEQIEASFHF